MVLSSFVRRTLLATAALGGAGVAALTYAGSHDDEPNPEVSFSVIGESEAQSDDVVDDDDERIRVSLSLSCVSLCLSFSIPSLFQSDHWDSREA